MQVTDPGRPQPESRTRGPEVLLPSGQSGRPLTRPCVSSDLKASWVRVMDVRLEFTASFYTVKSETQGDEVRPSHT